MDWKFNFGKDVGGGKGEKEVLEKYGARFARALSSRPESYRSTDCPSEVRAEEAAWFESRKSSYIEPNQ